jgi:hypothetical protein
MAHLFLSYAREDRECAELLAGALAKRGWTVWWDRRIQVGRSFSEVIESELEKARCVIVLWSQHALNSEWVQNEAAEAARRKVMVPVRIEDVRLPLEFRRLQTADLFEWRKGFESPEFDACLASIEMLVKKTGSRPLSEPKAQPETPPPPPQSPRQSAQGEFRISQNGQQFSAPDAATLRRWADEGRVTADSYVYDPMLQRWIRANEVPALQSAYQPQPSDQGSKRTTSRRPLIIIGVGVVLVLIIVLSTRTSRRPSPEITYTDPKTTDTSPTMATETASATTTQAAATTMSQPVSISVENRCVDNISVAICYLNSANQWIGDGWYNVDSQKTQPNIAQATGPIAYFYAMSNQSIWQGAKDDPLTRMFPINRTAAFRAPVDEIKGEAVPFFGRRIDTGQSTYTQLLTCN